MSVSYLNLYKNIEPDPALVSSITEKGTIYFLSNDLKSLRSINLNGTELKKGLIKMKHEANYLYLRKTSNPALWDIVTSQEGEIINLMTVDGKSTDTFQFSNTIDYVADLRDMGKREINVSFSRQSIHAYTKDKKYIDSYYEVLFFWGAAFQPTIIPGNKVVFELGGQIVVLDLNNGKIGFITNGAIPVVVLK